MTRRLHERGTVSAAATPPPGPPGAPRWARRAAVLAVMTTVPSGIWRISMALGLPSGATATACST